MLYRDKLIKDPVFNLIKSLGLEQTAKLQGCPEEEILVYIQNERYKWDSESFCSEQLKISNKDGMIVPFKLNNGQRIMRDAVERQQRAGKPVRIKLLKARQWGGSTYWEALMFRESVLKTLRNTLIVAHDLDSAKHLRDMTSRYYEYYNLSKPPIKKEGDKWWKFQHKVGGKSEFSNIRIDTAEEISIGHSLTNHNIHISEIQAWRGAQERFKGLFPTVPKSADTMILVEGTGSGVGDFWYDLWEDGDDGWEHVFVAWWQVEWYQQAFTSEDERSDFEAKLDEEEKLLYKQGIGLEALNWRRMTIRMDYKGDLDSFRQQFPATPDEAFLTSGRPVFRPTENVKSGMLASSPPIKTGYLEYVGTGSTKSIVFEEDPKGFWEIWEEPLTDNKSNLYCAGVDSSMGRAVIPELGNRGSDYQCVKIKRRDNGNYVARLHQRIDPDLVADELDKACDYWRGLKILIENNPGGCGNIIIRALKKKRAGNLLREPVLDKRVDDIRDEYGYNTNSRTKRLLIDPLAEQIRENRIYDKSKNFWYECSTYVRDEKGGTDAQPRKYDDEVIATALCEMADTLLPSVFDVQGKNPKAVTDVSLDVPENWKRWKRNRSEVGLNRSQLMEKTYGAF